MNVLIKKALNVESVIVVTVRLRSHVSHSVS